MFFHNWTDLFRTVVVGVCAYGALLFLVRISGKRTLSKMNAFDLIVTVALGSTLATILLSNDVALAEGVLALGLLIVLQFIITWLSVRSETVSRLVKAEPRLLFHKGKYLQSAMKAERVNKEELLQAMRSEGIGREEQVEAVVLETDGSFSIVYKGEDDTAIVLSNVSGYEEN
ncbi:MAG: DUF421 domain-containing protein [Chloroflexota bacterium]|nr:DUF421 domain-containing protein [Chloroflexota bacterium]